MFRDMRAFIQHLEANSELMRVHQELSPKYEVSAAVKYIARQKGTAVLCEKVTGYQTPLVGNLLGSRKRFAFALGVAQDEVDAAYQGRRQNTIKPQVLSSALVQEVVIDHNVNIIQTIPVLTHHEGDAGPYFTSAFTVAKDPETGMQSAGLHRIQVRGPDTIGILLATPPLSNFLAKAEKQGKPLEVAVVSGADPLTFWSSVISAPEGPDKLEIAGGLAQEPIKVVKCRSVNLCVPAMAEFVLEGYIKPRHRAKEGPFGESTGYPFTFDSPVAQIQAITHRRQPVYHALVPFGPEDELLMCLSLSLDWLAQVRKSFPQVQNLRLTHAAAVVLVQIDKKQRKTA